MWLPHTLLAVWCGLVVWLSPTSRPVEADDAPVQVDMSHAMARLSISAIIEAKSVLDERRRAELSDVLLEEAVAARFDPLFIIAIIEDESGFDYEAVSPTGARGLMQILPSTWKQEAPLLARGHMDYFNPCDNVRVGVSYLGRLASGFSRPESLLLAYNQGSGAAADIIAGRASASAEGSVYVLRVMRIYRGLLKSRGLDDRNPRRYWRSPKLTLLAPTWPDLH